MKLTKHFSRLNKMLKPVMLRRVVGHSMWPALAPDDLVVATGLVKPRIGEVVVANVDGREVIKRVAAISDQGYWLLGDNRPQSSDSRDYGYVPAASILGTVIGLRHTLRFNGLNRQRA